jgi:hypothetical protein
VIVELLTGTAVVCIVITPTPSSIVTAEEMSVVTDGTRAVPEALVTALPVAPLVTLKDVAVADVMVAPTILKAGVERPAIVTTCPAVNELAAVYVITPEAAEAAVTVAVRVGVVALTERVYP